MSFDFKIQWTPGKWNTVADALSRRRHFRDVATDTSDLSGSLNAIFTVTDDILHQIETACVDDELYEEMCRYLIDPDNLEEADDPEPVPPNKRTLVKC
jgi:hypothetical protein